MLLRIMLFIPKLPMPRAETSGSNSKDAVVTQQTNRILCMYIVVVVAVVNPQSGTIGTMPFTNRRFDGWIKQNIYYPISYPSLSKEIVAQKALKVQ